MSYTKKNILRFYGLSTEADEDQDTPPADVQDDGEDAGEQPTSQPTSQAQTAQPESQPTSQTQQPASQPTSQASQPASQPTSQVGSTGKDISFKNKGYSELAKEVDDEQQSDRIAQAPTIVISSFVCSGASTWAANNEWVKDLESSLYSKKPDGSKSDDFPNNYIDAIKWQLTNCNWKYLLVSSHQEVREGLKAAGIKFYLFYPALERKDEIIKLCQDRGNDAQFIQLLQENYESWVTEMSKEENAYPLAEGEFLSDALFETKFKFLKQ